MRKTPRAVAAFFCFKDSFGSKDPRDHVVKTETGSSDEQQRDNDPGPNNQFEFSIALFIGR